MAGYQGDGGLDPETQRFLELETQKARFNTNVHMFTDTCWEKCVDRVPNRMDSKTEQCFKNCVGRFIDTSNLVVNKLSSLKQ